MGAGISTHSFKEGMSMVSRCCRTGLVLVLGLFFCLTPGAAHAALPNGSIAILVKSASAQEAAQTASVFTRQLLARGYKVVDPKKLAVS